MGEQKFWFWWKRNEIGKLYLCKSGEQTGTLEQAALFTSETEAVDWASARGILLQFNLDWQGESIVFKRGLGVE